MPVEELDAPLLSFNTLRQIWGGRQRSLRAVMIAAKIEGSYRKTAQKVKEIDFKWEDSKKLYHDIHEQNAKLLYTLCHENGGSWTKFGQFLSARPDLLPKEYIKALEPLQNDINPTPFYQLKTVLEEQLGPDWANLFAAFDEKPIATASIGQVHKATTMDGREVAVKIQLPEISKLFAQDVVLFRTIANLLKGKLPQVDVPRMVEYLLKTVGEEMDFTNEASNIIAFGKLKHVEGVKVPTLVEELSTEKVITTEWIEGVRLVDYLSKNHGMKQKRVLFMLQNSYVQQVMRHGLYQGDPHPGNFLVDADGNLHILDYGYMGKLSKLETRNFVRLIMIITKQSTEDIMVVLEETGFEGLTKEMFEGDARSIIGSVSGANRTSKMDVIQIDVLISNLLEQFRENHVTVPDYFISVSRVFVTVGGLLRTYNVPFNIMGTQSPFE